MTRRSVSPIGVLRSLVRRAPEPVRRGLRRLLVAPVAAPAPLPEPLLELGRHGPAPLARRPSPAPAVLRVAIVLPSFLRGSGGHTTVVNLARALAGRGHAVSLWLEDHEHSHERDGAVATQRRFAEFFAADDLPLTVGFEQWHGADVVVATGWHTVPRVLRLEGVAARAYLVQDHEPEFYPTSAESVIAADTYRAGLHCIAASPWLAELIRTRYGASASHFDLAVDHDVYRPATEPRRDDLVVFYARASTPRRAVPLGLLALEELARRRASVEIVLFGADHPSAAPFPHTDLRVAGTAALAALYHRATVGMSFSLTNPSLVELEMLACGLPCVELGTEPVRETFGPESPLVLADPSPLGICSTLEALLDDPGRRALLSTWGPRFVASRRWAVAAEQVERELRRALEL